MPPCALVYPPGLQYTRATRSFLTHHGRRISHAIVIVGAQSIMNEILKLKKSALAARPAQ